MKIYCLHLQILVFLALPIGGQLDGVATDPNMRTNNKVLDITLAMFNYVRTMLNMQTVEDQAVTYWCMQVGIPNFIQTYRNDPKIHLKLNVKRPIAFLIHGWLDDVQRDWLLTMARNYVRFARTNVCAVNWHPMSVNDYAMAADKTDSVAKVTTRFVKYLTKVGFKYENMTIVGHSMGAHIAGMIGHRTGGKIGHIIGLDPAGVLFTKLGRRPTVRLLDRMSARFVQVLHTDKHTIGTTVSLGHQDFWPNDGKSPQPGCVIPLLQPDAPSYLPTICSHAKAFQYFDSSLNPAHQFWAASCLNFEAFQAGWCSKKPQARFGIYNQNRNLTGNFYLNVGSQAPYALGHIKYSWQSVNQILNGLKKPSKVEPKKLDLTGLSKGYDRKWPIVKKKKLLKIKFE